MTRTWMPREQWDALVRGEGCVLCETIAQNAEDDFAFPVAELSVSRLRLAKNQYILGYCTLINKRHVCELHDLTPDERHQFSDDLARASQAIAKAFDAIKINLLLLGNSTPHLHAHIIPRYFNDPEPNRPIEPWAETRYLDDYSELLRKLRAALE